MCSAATDMASTAWKEKKRGAKMKRKQAYIDRLRRDNQTPGQTEVVVDNPHSPTPGHTADCNKMKSNSDREVTYMQASSENLYYLTCRWGPQIGKGSRKRNSMYMFCWQVIGTCATVAVKCLGQVRSHRFGCFRSASSGSVPCNWSPTDRDPLQSVRQFRAHWVLSILRGFQFTCHVYVWKIW